MYYQNQWPVIIFEGLPEKMGSGLYLTTTHDKRRYYPLRVLEQSVSLFSNVDLMTSHRYAGMNRLDWPDRIGRITWPKWDAKNLRLVGLAEIKTQPWQEFLEVKFIDGSLPQVGLSMVPFGIIAEIDQGLLMAQIKKVISVDLALPPFEPAGGGRFLNLAGEAAERRRSEIFSNFTNLDQKAQEALVLAAMRGDAKKKTVIRKSKPKVGKRMTDYSPAETWIPIR